MGSTYIQGFIDEGVSLDTCLGIHLTCNHYPPVSLEFLETCKQAIACINDNSNSTLITMPNGKTLMAWEIAKRLHLDSFISVDEYD